MRARPPIASRPRLQRARGAPAVALLVLLVVAGAADARVVIDGEREAWGSTPSGESGHVTFDVPFHLTHEGLFYAKLLPAPWNPAVRNGTVTEDHAAGVDGWWVTFTVTLGNGDPLTRDAAGDAVNGSLGAYADGTATPPLRLEGDASYHLHARVHVPADGAVAGAEYRVPFALGFREASIESGDASSGGSLEQSRGFTARVTVHGDDAAAPIDPDPETNDATATAPGAATPVEAAPATGFTAPVVVAGLALLAVIAAALVVIAVALVTLARTAARDPDVARVVAWLAARRERVSGWSGLHAPEHAPVEDADDRFPHTKGGRSP